MFHKQRYKIGSYFMDSRRAYGGGTALIMVHGIGVSGNYFMPLAKLLARHFDVHVVDMPGYGKTPKPSHPLSLRQQAEIVAGYMEKVGIVNAVIVGQSMGCQTAAQFAAMHPRLCKKLILIGPTANKWERGRGMQGVRLFIDTFLEPLPMNLIIFWDYLHMGLPAYWKTSGYMIADHIEQTLARVQAPVCIIRGKKDGIAPKKWVEYLATVAENAETHHLQGPHNVHFTNAKEVSAICEKFLQK